MAWNSWRLNTAATHPNDPPNEPIRQQQWEQIQGHLFSQEKMKFLIILFLYFLGLCLSSAHAQACPREIEANVELNQPVMPGWVHEKRFQSHALAGMSIIYGARAAVADGLEENLAPERSGETQFWPFRTTVGSSEMWMECAYQGTKLTLSTRISSDVVECFVTRGRVHKRGAEAVVGMCVNFRKYSRSFSK